MFFDDVIHMIDCWASHRSGYADGIVRDSTLP